MTNGGETKGKVLVVDDEPDIVDTLAYNLEQEGYTTIRATTGVEALEAARGEPPQLILLDLMLPDMSGTEVCRQLRSDQRLSATPIIMVTAKGAEIDRVVGFEVGADDYVTKPFSVREILLRMRAVLRRASKPAPGPAGTDAEDMIEFGLLQVEPAAHRLRVEGREVTLTALEFRLLITLLDRKGRVQTRTTLLEDVWGIHADVTTRTVDTHVKRLREKLGKAGAYIETIRGVGYRFRGGAGEAP